MKKIAFIVLALFITLLCYSETKKVIESKNEFGGITYEITYDKNDDNFQILEASRVYFDSKGKMVKSISRLSLAKRNEKGIDFQEQEYDGDGKVILYKMYVSEAEKKKCGYDYIVEVIGDNDDVVLYCYGYGDKVIREAPDSFAHKYPFHNLSFLLDTIYEDYKPNGSKDEYIISAKYLRGRSLVTFVSDVEPMTKKDKDIANYYFATFRVDGIRLYNYKVRINENGKEYILFLQDNLVEYIVKSKQALISFAVVGMNYTLYPLLTSLIDVE